MEKASKPLHFIVGSERYFVSVQKSELEKTFGKLVSVNEWNDFLNFCKGIFGFYADFVDLTEEVAFQEEELNDKSFVKDETLRFLAGVYTEAHKADVAVLN